MVNQQKELKKRLNEAAELYYNEGKLIMSDEKYDALKKEYEETYGVILEDGFEPSKRLVNTEHTFKGLVGTLLKANSIEDISDWMDGLGLESSKSDIDLVVSYKYDGNSISIEYKDGKVIRALTRGKGGKGADVTHIFKNRTIKDKRHMGIRYEAMLTYEDFEKISTARNSTYANPRSLVSGLLHDLEGYKYEEYIQLVPLNVHLYEDDLTRDEELKIGIIENTSKIPFVYEEFISSKEKFLENLEKYYKRVIDIRETELDYMIDGLVIELNDDKKREELGFIGTSPVYAIALKFPYMEKETVIERIEFDVSPTGTGRITPIAVYKPVLFNGAEQTRTSLASYKRYQELQPINTGTKVLVEYRNDVLSYVNKLDVEENDQIEHFEFIKTCPVCNGEVKLNENKALAFCSNDECPSKVTGKINKYLRELDVKGIELKTITKLNEEGLLTNIEDLYKIKYNDIKNLEGFGSKSAMEFIDAVKGADMTDYKVLAAMGIEAIGQRKFIDLLKEFKFDDLLKLEFISSDDFVDKVAQVDGFSKKLSTRLQEGLIKYNSLLNKIDSLTTISRTNIVKVDKVLRFVATGDTIHFADRGELKEYIMSKGHKMTGSVSGKTDYLITDNPNSGTVKNKEAQKRGIPIITDRELIDII